MPSVADITVYYSVLFKGNMEKIQMEMYFKKSESLLRNSISGKNRLQVVFALA